MALLQYLTIYVLAYIVAGMLFATAALLRTAWYDPHGAPPKISPLITALVWGLFWPFGVLSLVSEFAYKNLIKFADFITYVEKAMKLT